MVLVPVHRYIEPGCDDCLRKLEKKGYYVLRSYGNSAIDLARNNLAQQALNGGCDEIIWLDGDMIFTVDQIEHLRNHDQPFVAGIASTKSLGGIQNYKGLPIARNYGPLIEVEHVGFACVYSRAEIYNKIAAHYNWVKCKNRTGTDFYPWFMPMIEDNQYYPEDTAFCRRMRAAGLPVLIDPEVKLGHIGSYTFTL